MKIWLQQAQMQWLKTFSILAIIDKKSPVNAYEVFLNEKGKLRWKYFNGEEWVIYSKEPNTSWWKRFTARAMGWLPIDSQL